jgi:hypothetical protein
MTIGDTVVADVFVDETTIQVWSDRFLRQTVPEGDPGRLATVDQERRTGHQAVVDPLPLGGAETRSARI